MESILLAFLMGIGLCIVTVIGDLLVKQASLQTAFSGWKLIAAGAILWAFTALGWFFVMRKIKLSTLGVLYALGTVIFLTLISIFYFKEKINSIEIIGIIMAIISLIILYRFA